MTSNQEFITRGVGDDDWIYCLCGNNPAYDGLYPCLPDGTPVEPLADGPWDEKLYVCAKCGRIVNQDTLEVTGQRDPATINWADA